MLRYLAARLLQTAVTLLVIALLTFGLMHAVPGGPFESRAGQRGVAPAFVASQEAYYGLDAPVVEQFGRFLWQLLQGDLGLSFESHRPVTTILRERIRPSLILGGMAFLIVVALGVPLGMISAVRAHTRFDYASVGLSTILAALPGFVLAFVLLLVFSVWLHWFPVRLGRGFGDSLGSLQNGLLPALALAAPAMALLARLTRGAMLDVLHADYIRTARAKGLRDRVVYLRHALRNALIPILTLAGPLFASLVTGSIVIEEIFGLPGSGGAFITSISQRDYGMIMGTTLFFAAVIVVINFLVDLSYAAVDPRLRLPP